MEFAYVMLTRQIAAELLLLVKEYPVVTILGPRQAGKTTLSRMVLPGWTYSNLIRLMSSAMCGN